MPSPSAGQVRIQKPTLDLLKSYAREVDQPLIDCATAAVDEYLVGKKWGPCQDHGSWCSRQSAAARQRAREVAA